MWNIRQYVSSFNRTLQIIFFILSRNYFCHIKYTLWKTRKNLSIYTRLSFRLLKATKWFLADWFDQRQSMNQLQFLIDLLVQTFLTNWQQLFPSLGWEVFSISVLCLCCYDFFLRCISWSCIPTLSPPPLFFSWEELWEAAKLLWW
jgi:hypothetical protein